MIAATIAHPEADANAPARLAAAQVPVASGALLALDLGSSTDSAFYAGTSVRVSGRTPGDTLELTGRPIAYALSVPRGAPHPALAARAARFLISPDGARLMRSARLDVLEPAAVIGRAPPDITP